MRITEVVRGADLLKSTARQILLMRALSDDEKGIHAPVPAYFHCVLLRDEYGNRLAKRHDAFSIRQLRDNGMSPHQVLELAGCF
jgi:glutamyl/glutaminyl-tRNA synthetase